ncbi:MAG: methyltransferase regulatory domain-containing protein [Pseudomonadota bacterium]
MREWTQEHTAALDYQITYFAELNPARLPLVLAHQGLQAHDRVVHACELGYGTGLSTVIHAAASNVQWWGTDYNPAHAQWANALADRAGVPVQLHDQSFLDFCQREDLPDFDFIALHGVWSWVSDANRAVIIDFLQRKLRWGGVVYISYNALPGHAQMVPVRNLMKSYMDSMTPAGQGDLQRARAAYQFVQGMLTSNPQLADVHPLAKRTMDDLAHQQSNSYLNHEYLVQHWTPMSFSEVAYALQDARLRFACSAVPTHFFDEHFLVPSQREWLAQITDATTRETARDMLVNRQFRQDYWIKGGLQMPATQAQEALRAARVVLVRTASAASAAVVQAVFHTQIAPTTLAPLLAVLSDGQVHAVGDVLTHAVRAGLMEDEALRALFNLLGNGSLAVAQDEACAQSVVQRVLQLNAAICQQALHSADTTHLASAVTGGGVRVGQLHMQFLAFRNTGLPLPQQWAQALAARLHAAGVHVVRDGLPLTQLADMEAHITVLAQAFDREELPLLQTLQCVA